MSGLKIELKELELFKKQLKNDVSLERLIPDITIAVERFANQFEDRFQKVYKTKLDLNSLRFGGKVKPSEVGKTYLKYGLQYRFKPTKLNDFNYILIPSRSYSVAHIYQHRIRGQFSTGVISKVTKRKGQLQVDRLTGHKVFKGKGYYEGKLMVRRKSETWAAKPTRGFEGKRTVVQEAIGVPLNVLAGGLIEHDTEVKSYLDQFELSIIKTFSNFYIN